MMMCSYSCTIDIIFIVDTQHFLVYFSFFFTDTATTEIYTLSLHDALPISFHFLNISFIASVKPAFLVISVNLGIHRIQSRNQDRKSTRLNSSHSQISYAVFCLKKKKKTMYTRSNGATLSYLS